MFFSIFGSVLVPLIIVAGLAFDTARARWPRPGTPDAPPPVSRLTAVHPGESISKAIDQAEPGTVVVVDPGEYREQLVLRSGVSVRSRVPRAVSLRLPGDASEFDAAIVARDIGDASVSGFRIVGDAASPLGAGAFVSNSDLVLMDVEITGARHAAVEFGAGASGGLVGADIHDNPGSAVIVRAGAAPRLAHSVFVRNAVSDKTSGPVLVEAGAQPDIRSNTFLDIAADSVTLPDQLRATVARDNWFLGRASRPQPPERGGRRGRS
jgi:hypothetical protein